MKIVTVIPLKKGLLKEDLTYFSAQEIKKGYIAKISLRGKDTLGLVISTEDASTQKSDIKEMPFNLKKISGAKPSALWRAPFLEAVLHSADYFASTKSQSAVTMIPSFFRENYDELAKVVPFAKESDEATGARAEKLLFQAPTDERLSYYKTLIRGSFAEKKSVFVVLPTERDIRVFSEALSKGIENFSFSFHGSMPAKKITEQYKKAVSMDHAVLIIGTAPYLSIRRDDLKTVIVEHESSPAYKMQVRPFFDMRIFAEIFAEKIGAKLILADTLLRFETFAKKDTLLWNTIRPLSFRTEFGGNIIISGKYEEGERNKKFKILGDESVQKIEETISAGKNVFIFSLRKGLATYTICKDCGEPLLCESCMAPVTLYLSKDGSKRMFACNHCHTEKDPQTHCANCHSWNLNALGVGTETVHEEIKKIFSEKKKKVKIFLMDKNTVASAKAAEKLISEFEAEKGAILIGTELALYYLENKVRLSVMASFDSLWGIPSFRMSEKIVQLLSSVISITEHTLCIETRNENDPGILAFKKDNLLSFVRAELKDREFLGYPPYKRFIKITHSGNKEETMEAKKALAEVFREYEPEIFSGFVPKFKGKYMTNALIKLPVEKWSLPELSAGTSVNTHLLTRLRYLPFSFFVNVDPEDLL
ncbi:MAG TPA: hypothetical protein VFQ59_03240 [Candidatus Paceibacterota bacterium]|nr:hypothetical protein [Candidatus Paceibacterota bacterium]